MLDSLLKKFIKNAEDVKNPNVRYKYGVFAGIFGIICNVFLTVFKIVTGLVTGTMSIVGDSINNLSDAVSSIVTLIGFKISAKAADKNHPYGHGRIEYLAGLTVSVAVIAIALDLGKTSIETIIEPSRMDVSLSTIIILVVAILVKIGMSLFYYKIARIIDSAAMRATASDSRSDCITTAVALLAVIVKIVWDVNIDGYAGLIVSFFVIKAGIDAARDTIVPLLGTAPDPEVIERMRELALQHEEIVGVHDIRIHEYGPARCVASMHVEIPAEVGMIRAHEIVDSVERDIEEEQLVGEVTIHVDPVISDDEELNSIREWTRGQLQEIDPVITMHDFRLIHGRVNQETGMRSIRVLFELEVPYAYQVPDEQIREEMEDRFRRKYPDYRLTIVAIDKA